MKCTWPTLPLPLPNTVSSCTVFLFSLSGAPYLSRDVTGRHTFYAIHMLCSVQQEKKGHAYHKHKHTYGTCHHSWWYQHYGWFECDIKSFCRPAASIFMEIANCFEMLVPVYETTWCHTPKDFNLVFLYAVINSAFCHNRCLVDSLFWLYKYLKCLTFTDIHLPSANASECYRT